MSHPESIPNVGEEERGCLKCLKRAGDWLEYKDKGEWLNEMRGSLSMTASIIATMTFQLATNPPGGVVQVSADKVTFDCYELCPGEAVLGASPYSKDVYGRFLVCNTISFVASLSVCLLLVSGIPLNHAFPIWLLSIGMCITITSLALTYLFAASMVTPDPIWDPTAGSMFNVVFYIWITLLGIVGVFIVVRVFICGVNKWIKKRNGQSH